MKKEWSPELLSVLRIIVAFLFIQHGAAKWFAFPAAVMPGGGVAAVASLPWFAGGIETIGGTLLLLGLFTRPVAFIVAGEMACAYFIGHAFQVKDIQDEILAGVGTYTVPTGIYIEDLKSGNPRNQMWRKV